MSKAAAGPRQRRAKWTSKESLKLVALAKTGLRRQREAQVFVRDGSLSFLEARSVRKPVLKDYQARARAFLNYCQVHRITWLDAETWDAALVVFHDKLFSTGSHRPMGPRWLPP